MSGDQARAGAEVPPVIDALRPGDILLLSARPGAGVTHVGMYVGELKFIHSSNRGVKLSRLDPADPEGAYWLDPWVGARRVIPRTALPRPQAPFDLNPPGRPRSCTFGALDFEPFFRRPL